MDQITVSELKARLDAGEDIQLIDVRQPDEHAVAKLPGSKLIPLGEVPTRHSEIDSTREAIVYCKMGGRSARAIEFLEQTGFKGKLTNLTGGITAWSNEIDPSVHKY